MSLFLVGQKVQLSNKPDMVFVIVEINPDQTYQIQYDCSLQEALHFNNISAEMMRIVESEA
ncbi:MAG: hypothetical protein KA474_09635 [Acinetobacter sp.]|nr:hypothetical protein [Acinetobacter sp.]